MANRNRQRYSVGTLRGSSQRFAEATRHTDRSGVLRRFRCSEPCPKLGWPNAVTGDVAFIEPGKFPRSQVDKLFYVARINDSFRARTDLLLSRALPIPPNPP